VRPPPKRLSRLQQIERTRKVWHAVLVAAGNLGRQVKLSWKHANPKNLVETMEMVRTFDDHKLPKSTKTTKGPSCFEAAARDLKLQGLHMSEASVRRIYYEELERRTAAGGWVPDGSDP